MGAWKMVGLPLTAVTGIGLVLGMMSTSSITACSSSSNSSSGSSGSGGSSSGACPSPLPAGTFPPADCLISDQSTCASSTQCPIAASCGSAAKDSCEPFADNSSKSTWDLRMRAIHIIAPKSLANDVVQNSVVTHGVDLNLAQCGEKGDGSFSWLLSFNPTTGELKTGGAPPSSDPLNTGYCFVNTTSDGITLAPITTTLTKNGDAYDSAVIPSLNIPIYYISGTTQQIITLPINGGKIQGLKFSQNGNCVGTIDTGALDNQCADQPSTCAKWHTDASIGGYITLKQADEVKVPLLQNKSLCVLLTGAAGLTCADASGTIAQKGDFCSTTNSAGGCADSFWLAATFAASAVKINDGSGVPDCTGGGSSSGGTDAGSSSGASDAASE